MSKLMAFASALAINICAAATGVDATQTAAPTPAVVPAESKAFADKLPGELIFQATYLHRSRGQDFSVPSMLWVKRSSENQIVATAYLPTLNSTDVAYVDPKKGLYRYESIGHGRDGTAPYNQVTDIAPGSVTIKYSGGYRGGETDSLTVPVDAKFQPNSRPDSYVAYMALLFQSVPAETYEMDCYDRDNTGKGMASYRTRVEYKGKESVTVPAGAFEARHYVETQQTFGDTWFKKRPGHITEYWVLDNGVTVRILRQREPYELQLASFTAQTPLPGAKELSKNATPVAVTDIPSGHATISVSVVHAETGAGVPAVDVFVRGGPNYTVQHAGVTDENGKYTFASLPAGQYSVSTGKPKGFTGAARQSATLATDDATVEVSLKLDAGIRVSGHVTDLDGKPIAGATVVARSWGNEGGNFNSEEAAAKQDGLYEIAGVPRGGRYRLFCKSPGYYSGYRTSQLNDNTQGIDFQLGRGAIVSGHAFDAEGKPMSRGSISLEPDFGNWRESENGMTVTWGSQVQLDADGRFEFKDAGSGKYRFHLWVRGDDQSYEQRSTGDLLEVAPGATLSDVKAVFPAADSERIEGTLRDETGAPVPNVNVDAITYEGVHWNAKTDANGHYKLVALGDHTFDIYFMHSELPDVKLPKIRPGKLDADAIMPHGGKIGGLVVDDATGNPLREGNVEIVWHKSEFGFERGYAEEHQSAGIKQDGTFETGSVLPGKAYLKVSAPGYLEKQSSGVIVKAGQTTDTVKLRVTPAAIVQGTVLAHGKPLDVEQGVSVMCLDDPIHEVSAGYIIHDGKYRLDRLPAGNYQISAWARGRGHMADDTKTIQVSPGQVMELNFVLDFPEPPVKSASK